LSGIVLLFVAAGVAALAQEPTYKNSIGMEFVLIRPGKFTAGRFQPAYATPPDPNAPSPAPGRAGAPLTPEEYTRIKNAALKDSSPGFEVTIARPYYLGTCEVTQAQYKQVMGTNPSVFQGSQITGAGDDHPVDSVTWADAQAFVKKLNQMEKTAAYRLPTEFEWEYAARAGADDDIPWSDIRAQGYNSGPTTQQVGKMKPNAWGLYDMLGNVWEWTQDYYNEKIFADPTAPRSGTQHVLKGGGFLADVKNMTYMWHGAGPGNRFDVGFRVVRDVR
jgi:formylglycine-generating enzyme required for sulfatase activity